MLATAETMSEQTTGKKTRSRLSQTLFGRLLSFWDNFRRPVLVLIITLTLVSMLSSLSPQTRGALLTAFFEQRLLVVLLLGFNLITVSLLWSAGQRLDRSIFLLFNLRGHHPLWLDRIMWVSTQIGNGLAGLLLGALFYYIGQRRLAIQTLLGILSLWLAVEITKAIIERTRPFLALEGSRIIGWRERGKSFPSGHTSQAFFMFTLMARHFHAGPLLGTLLFLIASTVAFTRIYVGAHYPRDVIAGAILGSVWGIMVGLVEVYLTTGQF